MFRITLTSVMMGLLGGMGVLAAAQASFAQATNPAIRLALEGARSDSTLAESHAMRFANVKSVYPDLVAVREAPEARIAPDIAVDDAVQAQISESDNFRSMNLEVSLNAPARLTGLNVDVSVAPRAAFELTPSGQRLRSTGAEVRLGRGLENLVRPFTSPDWDNPTWYFFAAADGSALTWRPEETATVLERGLRLQEERVVVGDIQAGVSMEANGMQASLSYIKRDVTNGQITKDESFVGATLTLRR
jgi:hypothetical protein